MIKFSQFFVALLCVVLQSAAMGQQQCPNGQCSNQAYAAWQAPTTQPATTYAAPQYAPAPQATWRYASQPAPATYAPAAYYASSQPTYQHASYVREASSSAGSYQDAMNIINAARLAAGRPPLPYDPNLAAWASRNIANPSYPHNVMAPGAGQCTAFVSDPATAARQWIASPAHYAILMNATQSIGISASPGGMTANAR